MRTGWIVLGAAATALLVLAYLIAASAGVLVVVMVIALLALVAVRPRRVAARPAKSTPAGRDPMADFSGYRQLRSAVTWGGGSQRDWDIYLRPKLTGLLDVVLADRCHAVVSERPDLACSLLGERLWPLLDPARPRCGDRDEPGPGQPALSEILDRLEAAGKALEAP